jgi:lipopolysaccharide transport system ATP-binding protein
MGDVSRGEGKTVLFVSHNMPSVKALCNKGMILNNGNISYIGESNEAIDYYLDLYRGEKNQNFIFERAGIIDSDIYLQSAFMCGLNGEMKSNFEINEMVFIRLNLFCNKIMPGIYGYITISNNNEIIIIESDTKEYGINELSNMNVGDNWYLLKIPPNVIPHGDNFVNVNFTSAQANSFNVDSPGYILKFQVTDNVTTRNIRRTAMTSQIINWEKINE